ncbi:DUF4062 domain-containing protein [Maribellus luteus]|uniref:DUF4062 domain-containing protein n=1 Tax=Maribellus luteus TaxID=2305463 RepID=A0A399T365_9BACT|nr:DUF4062 domain-containing protein [Maribellus luteus]RIJ49344.1 DUF4062 domain-containing protein [Maribellus luteus]
MNKRYQVFVSSTYADLKEERAKVIQTIMELDCIPAGMEIFPAIDEEQFDFIKKVIDDCDYYLLIIGGRYGSLSEDGISYTEKEYDYANQKNTKIIAFIHANPDEISFGKSEKDSELRMKLEEFKKKVATNRLVKFWNRLDELPGLVALSLSKTIKTYPAIGWTRANSIADPNLYKQLSELQKQNQELKEFALEQQNLVKSDQVDLADLDDKINISGKYRIWDKWNKREIISDWKISISWKQIFSLFSPYLIDHPNDVNAKSILSTVIHATVPDARTSGTATIDDQEFQTIKIHFKALGLTDIKYTQTTKGGMALFWYLTPKGENLMINLRSVKK